MSWVDRKKNLIYFTLVALYIIKEESKKKESILLHKHTLRGTHTQKRYKQIVKMKGNDKTKFIFLFVWNQKKNLHLPTLLPRHRNNAE